MAMYNPLTQSFICTAQAADTAVIKPSMTKGFFKLNTSEHSPKNSSNIKAPYMGYDLRTLSTSLSETILVLCLSNTARTKINFSFHQIWLFGQEPGPTVSVGSAPVKADNTQAEVVVLPSPISPKEKDLSLALHNVQLVHSQLERHY